MSRLETIAVPDGPPSAELAPGVAAWMLATGASGAVGLTTALGRFRPGAFLPYHRHPFSEVVLVLAGQAQVQVEGRRYRLTPFDALHLPAGTPHAVQNGSPDREAVLFSTFASDVPLRGPVDATYEVRDLADPTPADPENLMRFASAEEYELAPNTRFRDLFARRFGARGICGGYGVFQPGTALPCHFHAYDESITIVAGQAVCQVAGTEYVLANNATACVPRGRPHRFLNRGNEPMAMVWVYAGDEPERILVEPGYCEGTIPLESLRPDDSANNSRF